MKNVKNSSEQPKNNQALIEQIPIKQSKNTWVEPALVSMRVQGGLVSSTVEGVNYNSDSRSS